MGRPGGALTRFRLERQITDHQITCDGAIAQLGERYNGIVEVSGSIPLSSTIIFYKNPATSTAPKSLEVVPQQRPQANLKEV